METSSHASKGKWYILIVKGSIDLQKESSVFIIWSYFLNSFPYYYFKRITMWKNIVWKYSQFPWKTCKKIGVSKWDARDDPPPSYPNFISFSCGLGVNLKKKNSHPHHWADLLNIGTVLGFIYIRAKATSLLTCCIVSDLCIYTTATAMTTNIKEKSRLRSNINEPLNFDGHGDGDFDVNCVQTLSHDTSI